MSEADDQIAKAEAVLREAIEGIADHPNAKKDEVQAMHDGLNLLVGLASTRYKAAERGWRQDSALRSERDALAHRVEALERERDSLRKLTLSLTEELKKQA